MNVKKVAPATPPHSFEAYAQVVSPLAVEDGGGFLFTMPDLPGCLSDGETPMQAITNGRDAFAAWVSAAADAGRAVPAPSYRPEAPADVSGRFVARVPKSVHASLARRARAEGVSLNTLVLTFIAQGLGPASGQ